MVSNRHTHGLIFPKGGWETDETAEEAAARESMEEAGVRGGTHVRRRVYVQIAQEGVGERG